MYAFIASAWYRRSVRFSRKSLTTSCFNNSTCEQADLFLAAAQATNCRPRDVLVKIMCPWHWPHRRKPEPSEAASDLQAGVSSRKGLRSGSLPSDVIVM